MWKLREEACCIMANELLSNMIEMFCKKYYRGQHYHIIMDGNPNWLNDNVCVWDDYYTIEEIYQALWFQVKKTDLNKRSDMVMERAEKEERRQMNFHSFLIQRWYKDKDSEYYIQWLWCFNESMQR